MERKSRLAPFSSAGIVVLLYHGVTTNKHEPAKSIENFSGKHIYLSEFEHQCRFLKQFCTPLPFREIVYKLTHGIDLPSNATAVTFDDSYENLFTVALPILKQYQIPATFFINTSFIGTNKRYWTDKLEHIIDKCSKDVLNIDHPLIKATFPLTSYDEKVTVIIELKRIMKILRPKHRDDLLSYVRLLSRVTDTGSEVLNYRNLNWSQVGALHEPPFFEIGGHTANHEILSYLRPAELDFEIEICLCELRNHLGITTDLFSYPEGQLIHFNGNVINRLKAYGVSVCPTAISGFNYHGIDPFRLYRNMVGFMGAPFPFYDENYT